MADSCIGLGKKTIIGMVHCLPLPGTPGFDNDCERIIEQAVQDAKTLEKAGCDAVCIENMGDAPLAVVLDPPQSIALSAISALVKKEVSLPFGIDAAFNDFRTSLSIAKILGADFVRIPVFVDTVVYFGGIIQPAACECMRFRKELRAENIKVIADIQVKYTHMVHPAISLEESALTAVSCGADGLIVTGTASGCETPIESIERIKNIVPVPVIAGSGVNKNNIKAQLDIADGAIIGSSLKEGGIMSNPIDLKLTTELVNALHE